MNGSKSTESTKSSTLSLRRLRGKALEAKKKYTKGRKESKRLIEKETLPNVGQISRRIKINLPNLSTQLEEDTKIHLILWKRRQNHHLIIW